MNPQRIESQPFFFDLERRKKYDVPKKIHILREIFGIGDLVNLFFHFPDLLNSPKIGNSERILLLPGYKTDEKYMNLLNLFLTHLGYKSVGWGLGENHGEVPELLENVKERIQSLFQEKDEKIILIGWSLGGYIAREAARDLQDMVSKVISIGSPIIGGPKYTAIGDLYKIKHKIDLQELESEIDERYRVPLNLPLLSIYSKKDNIVSWEACIDNYSPNSKNEEVESTHIGLIANYEVFKKIEDFLSIG